MSPTCLQCFAVHSLAPNRAPFPSNNSLVSLFGEAIQYSLVVNNTRADIPHVIIANSGSQRYDVFGGPFTKNDQVTASPFTNAFVYVANVSASAAGKMLSTLNEAGEQDRRRALRGEFDEDGMTPREREAFARGDVDMVFYRWLADMSRAVGRRDADNATLGYVTKDSCPGVGDDIPHTPLVSHFTHPPLLGFLRLDLHFPYRLCTRTKTSWAQKFLKALRTTHRWISSSRTSCRRRFSTHSTISRAT